MYTSPVWKVDSSGSAKRSCYIKWWPPPSIIASWNRTFSSRRRGPSWSCRGWQSWGSRRGPSPGRCTPCSSRHRRCRAHRRWRSDPGRSRSCTRRRFAPGCRAARTSRRWRTCRHTSRRDGQWPRPPASGKIWGLDDAWPLWCPMKIKLILWNGRNMMNLKLW